MMCHPVEECCDRGNLIINFSITGEISIGKLYRHVKIGECWFVLTRSQRKRQDIGPQNQTLPFLHACTIITIYFLIPFLFLVASKENYLDPREMISSPLKSKSASDLANAILTIQANEEQNSDITLICGDRQFPAHKVILAARSNVFAAMFRHSNTREAATNEVMIKDTDPDTLERFLR